MRKKAGGAPFFSPEYLDYASPDLRAMVHNAADVNHDRKMSVEEYTSFIVLMGSDNVDARLKGAFT